MDRCGRCGHDLALHGRRGFGACRHGHASRLEVLVAAVEIAVARGMSDAERKAFVDQVDRERPEPCPCRRATKPKPPERRAWLTLSGWAGTTRHPVTVIGETAARYRVRADDCEVRLGGRGRRLPKGESTLVPRRAVAFGREAHETAPQGWCPTRGWGSSW